MNFALLQSFFFQNGNTFYSVWLSWSNKASFISQDYLNNWYKIQKEVASGSVLNKNK